MKKLQIRHLSIRLFSRGNEIKNDDYLYKYNFNENAPVMFMLNKD